MTGRELFAAPEADGQPTSEPVPAGELAAVAPEVPVPGCFTYRIPPGLAEQVLPGVRVQVPFGGRRVDGWVVEVGVAPPPDLRRLRPIARVLDPRPLLDPQVLELARWAADYYATPLGEVLGAAVPREASAEPERVEPWLEATGAAPPRRLGAVQEKVLLALGDGPRPLAAVRQASGCSAAQVARLEALGLVRRCAPPADAAPSPAEAPRDTPPELTAEQRLALAPLLRQLEGGEPSTTLLFGITGSGKTEVYLRAIARALELGKGAIVLVPEIALTPQTLERFRARFGAGVAVLHSQLGTRDRRREWGRVQRGEARVVVGPRSAVWAPVRELGLIVVDEEHESTYKQEQAPRYHARDLAVVRGRLARAPVVLGSATPALESWHNAAQARYRIARLRARPAGATLPAVKVVDMAAEWADVRGAPLLSRVLVSELQQALGRGERALLFQNRRGFTTYLQCPGCGQVQKCRQCDIALTYHRAQGALLCHFCDLRAPPPGGPCPACKGPPLRQRGAGTERIEELVRERFPGLRVGRLDTDVVREGEAVAAVLDRFRRGEVQLLVGTQMIAKGLDVPDLTVVGVISADTSLGLPDFRASERTYQLVAQVAGRAGRGSRPGTTVIQTFLPQHFALAAAARHGYEEFAQEELKARRALGYPPFTRLLKVLWRGPEEAAVRGEAEAAVEALRAACQADPEVLGVLGPAPSPRAFLAGKVRWQALIKASARGVRGALEALRQRKAPAKVEVVLDVDPYHLL